MSIHPARRLYQSSSPRNHCQRSRSLVAFFSSFVLFFSSFYFSTPLLFLFYSPLLYSPLLSFPLLLSSSLLSSSTLLFSTFLFYSQPRNYTHQLSSSIKNAE